MKDVNDQATIVITQDNASLDFPLFILTPLLYVSFFYTGYSFQDMKFVHKSVKDKFIKDNKKNDG